MGRVGLSESGEKKMQTDLGIMTGCFKRRVK